MAKKTLTQKVFKIVGSNPDSFNKTKERQLQNLLTPKNNEMSIKKVKKWEPCKGNW